MCRPAVNEALGPTLGLAMPRWAGCDLRRRCMASVDCFRQNARRINRQSSTQPNEAFAKAVGRRNAKPQTQVRQNENGIVVGQKRKDPNVDKHGSGVWGGWFLTGVDRPQGIQSANVGHACERAGAAGMWSGRLPAQTERWMLGYTAAGTSHSLHSHRSSFHR